MKLTRKEGATEGSPQQVFTTLDEGFHWRNSAERWMLHSISVSADGMSGAPAFVAMQ